MAQYGYMAAVRGHPKDVIPSALIRQGFLEDEGDETQRTTDNSDTSSADPSKATQQANPETQDGYEKRYWDLKKYHDAEISKERQRAKELEAQLKAKDKQAFKPPKTKEELDVLRKEFPDVFDAMMTLAMEQTAHLKEEFSSEIEELKKARQEEYTKLGREKILARHPDADKLIRDPKFLEWYETRSAGIKQLFSETAAPEDLIEGFDLYKASTGKKSTNNKDLEASMAVDVRGEVQPSTGKTGKVWKESEVAKIAAQGLYDRYEADIDKAIAEGRFVYDLSAPTR